MALQGDSVWDLLAARRAGCLGDRRAFGGIWERRAEQVGAYPVYQDPADLLAHLDEVGIRIMDQVVKERTTRFRANLLSGESTKTDFSRLDC
jgi:hypothetical protein